MKPQPYRVDSSKPYADPVNRSLKGSDGMQFDALYNQVRVAYAGDELADTVIPDTTLPWNTATEIQKQIAVAYSEMGLDRSTLQAELTSNQGPIDPRYMSYEQWWLVPGVTGDAQA